MRMPRTKKTIIITAVGAAALLGGGFTVASAATGGGSDKAVVGTVKAPAETTPEGADTPASEKAQSDQLAALATVTADQAKAAAEKAVGGTATAVSLGDSDGFVVYDVSVTSPTGPVEVLVDAGSGAVLAQEAGDAGEGKDSPEGAETADGSTGTGTTTTHTPAPTTAG